MKKLILIVGLLVLAGYMFPSLLPWGSTEDEEPQEKVENVQKKAAPVQVQSKSSEEAELVVDVTPDQDIENERKKIREAAAALEDDQTCTVADYTCGAWGPCMKGWQLRVCKLYNTDCRPDIPPQEQRSCTTTSRE